MGRVKIAVVAGVLAVGGAAAAAQAGRGGEQARAEQIQARFQLLAMEGVLERAVQLGAQRVRAQVQAVAPDMLFITGAARARGFRLDGYGVFFDVDVPAMRRSLAWTFRVMEQSDRGLELAMTSFKRQIAAVENPAVRRELQQTLQQLEAHVGPTTMLPAGPGATGVRTAAPVRAGDASTGPERHAEDDPSALDDPGETYTSEVKRALAEAMIEYSAPLPIADDEWLTVAARDEDGSRLQPGDPYEVSTILLRIKGSDLAAYHAGRIDRGETRKRVEIREY